MVRLNSALTSLGFSFERQARAPTVWGFCLASAGVAWALTIRATTGMGNGPGTMGLSLVGFMPLWVAMMAAMMLPSVAPAGSMYLRGVKMRSASWLRALRVGLLIVGYLGVWAAFGVFAFVTAWGAGRLAGQAPRAALSTGAAILAVAGLYQVTPLKERCLKQCRSPLGLLLHYGSYSGRLRDLRVGIAHGGFCLGCCWGLMVVLIAVGVMNVAWMAGLAAVIFLEKTWRYGKALGIAFGIGLVVLALFVPSHPGLVPGLHGTGMMRMGS